MTDARLVCAEMMAGDLLAALQAAVDGAPHWRLRASVLLDDINNPRLPALAAEALREADARKRQAEIMSDLADVR